MKKLIFSAFLFINAAMTATAGDAAPQGITYFLPKTQLKFSFVIEKTVFTPGQYAQYAERFLKNKAESKPSTTYRILGISMQTASIPDSAKQHTVVIDKKHSIFNMEVADGILRAINTETKKEVKTTPKIMYHRKARPLNVNDFMNEDMLNAGSEIRVAQLMATEICDIRDSRNQLSRGEADNMPKDGEQLKLMFDNLNTQERAFTEAFMGREEHDTITTEVVFTPSKETKRELLCRFSKRLGMVDNDDMAGAPVYISTEDLKMIPELEAQPTGKKNEKEDIGLYVNLPGRIHVTITKDGAPIGSFETYAAQYGHEEQLGGEMFGKKFISKLILDPVTGNVLELKTEPLD